MIMASLVIARHLQNVTGMSIKKIIQTLGRSEPSRSSSSGTHTQPQTPSPPNPPDPQRPEPPRHETGCQSAPRSQARCARRHQWRSPDAEWAVDMTPGQVSVPQRLISAGLVADPPGTALHGQGLPRHQRTVGSLPPQGSPGYFLGVGMIPILPWKQTLHHHIQDDPPPTGGVGSARWRQGPRHHGESCTTSWSLKTSISSHPRFASSPRLYPQTGRIGRATEILRQTSEFK